MLLVSIHDVTPALAQNVHRLWGLCASHGLTPALLIVPNWHGRWALENHPDFVEWARDRANEGAELVLHGDTHDEVGLPRTLWDSCRAWGRTNREGEFLTLKPAAAGERLNRGIARLRAVGLEPTGFVAPAWLAREGTHRVAAAAGLAFTEDARFIYLLGTGRRVPSPVVRWSARTELLARGSALVAAGRWLMQRSSRFPRIALHPGDLDHPATAASVKTALGRWSRWHRPGRYADLSATLQPA
jgi:predicted deacetylase